MYPGDKRDGPLSTDDIWRFWTRARDAAGIVSDARLHDLRHAHASHAVVNGESLHVAGGCSVTGERPRPTATFISTTRP